VLTEDPIERFKASHITFPPRDQGLDVVEERYGITLPEDIKLFYKKWSMALLVLQD
jgi:hypothetical protein